MRLRLFFIMLSLLGLSTPAWSAFLVVPRVFAEAEGDSANAFPFNSGAYPGDASPMRYQQRYAAAEFGTEPIVITQLAFRPDSTDVGSGSATIAQLTVGLSTAASTSLEPRFSLNMGSDHQQVFAGPLVLRTDNSFDGETKSFDVVIELSQPFLYDPAKGDLLLDVWNASGEFLPEAFHGFDAGGTRSAGTISRVFSVYSVDAEDKPLPVDQTAGFSDSMGLVTRFAYTPVEAPAIPEPAGFAALVAAAALTLRRGTR